MWAPLLFLPTHPCTTNARACLGSDGGYCTLLVPMDRPSVSRTVYKHERYEDEAAGGAIKWQPVGKAPKETYLEVSAYHRRIHEHLLMRLYGKLDEVSRSRG